MARIRQLPPLVVSQIAAGEVIERPASVVKELLENAIDAGSTRLEVDVGQGGKDSIRVVDNGSGIERDDLPLAFAPHATSKLRSADDLFRIGTLGFRGEGRASIGGVTQVTLQSPSRPALWRRDPLPRRAALAGPLWEQVGSPVQYLFVNGRWVRDRGLSQALQEAGRGLSGKQGHRAAFLFLDVPGDQVDVNVHPTKAEIRFRHPEKVQQLVQETVRARLQGAALPPAVPVRAGKPELAGKEEQRPAALPFDPVKGAATAPAENQKRSNPADTRSASRPTPARPEHTTRKPIPPGVPQPSSAATKQPASRPAPPTSPPVPSRPLRAMQLHDHYLVIEVPEGMLVLDQHALHERILFAQLQDGLASGRLEVQRLPTPEPVTLSAAQAALVLEQREALADVGVEVEDFGGGTVLLSGYPALLGKYQPRHILPGLVEYLLGKERPSGREALLHDLLALIARHAAVRGGERLTPEEVAELGSQWELAGESSQGPHGRPLCLRFTRADLDRQFRRT